MSQNISWHTLPVREAIQRQHSDLAVGLSHAEAARRLLKHGTNSIVGAQPRPAFAILLSQFQSLMMALLAAATAIAFATGDNIEAVAILAVVALNVGIGFFTEWKADRALNALRMQTVKVAHVLRGGVECKLPAAELVPGDLVVLVAGDGVPADGRIVESARLQVEEAALTGESQAVAKTSDRLSDPNAVIGDVRNMAYLGTTVTNGRGKMLVTATGARTEVGKIGVLINEAASQSTPLEQKLTSLGRLLIAIVLTLCLIIVAIGWLRGVTDFWHMLKIGLSLAIAAVPEGLPAITAMTLALGMHRMAQMGALIRKLPAVETLGSVTVICSDKTGTLTKNEMTACVYVLHDRRIEVTGVGYEPVGSFHQLHSSLDPIADSSLSLALRIGALCNDAKFDAVCVARGILGDPTEAALIVAAEKAGMSRSSLDVEFPRIGEIPFDSEAMRMVTIHRTPQGGIVSFVKGAPATLLDASSAELQADGAKPLTPCSLQRWKELNRELAGAALRVLGLAYRELPGNYDETYFNHDLIFVGLVGMSDPLREEATTAINGSRGAGIRTVMITGDQQPMAAEIGRRLGIDRDFNGRPLRTIHGRELTALDAVGWSEAVGAGAVFARVSPEQKLKIIETLQHQGHVVAMTGDGVNDGPALKKADIGIAMGIKGTEVAKENSDMVITDDNFSTIVSAIQQGRIIYGNILRFLHYLLSCNLSEILTVFFALTIGWPLPLAPLQILWLNLITDVFPAFALALEPSAPGVMARPPRNPHEPLLTWQFIGLIAWQGVLIATTTLFAFAIGMRWYGLNDAGLNRATTNAFMTLALAQVFHAFSSRSRRRSALTSQLWTNRWFWGAVMLCLVLQGAAVYLPLLQRVLQTLPPNTSDWVVIAVCSLLPLVVVEVVKASLWLTTLFSLPKSPMSQR